MNPVVTISSLAVLFTCHALCAQQPPPRSAGGGLAERFKQLDRNGDGKLTRDDLGQSPLLDQWDANKDGAVTLEEVSAFYTKRRADSDTTRPERVRNFKPMQQDFKVEDVRVSPPGRPMVDPEFNDVQYRVADWDYAGAQLNISVAELDPRTGLLKSDTGRDFAVAERVAPNFKQGQWYSHNGPEWGRDRNGWAI